jgi:ribonuclease HI
MDADRPVITVYTDGACRGNPGRGGWAWAVPAGPFASGYEPATTNQRMEITAALEALRTLTADGVSDVDVVSDSTYVVNCFKDRWWQGWQRRNWKNSQNKPVANRDLWEPLIELAVSSESSVTWRWVKGHSGDRWNDRVDELATLAADRGRGETGGAP